jgi:hypothetical protein
MVRIQTVKVLEGFQVRVGFTDGAERDIDLAPYLHGPVFEPLRHNPELFRAVSVDPRMRTLVWPNGADIDPDVLYFGLKPAWMEAQSAPARSEKP